MTRSTVALTLIGLIAGACAPETALRARTNTDTWLQAPNNEVDILWVVDDSCSMGEEQETLSVGFVSFVDEMEASGTDFHIGLITTSFDYNISERGVLVGEPQYLTSADDYVTLFAERALVGTDGSDKEKGLEAAAYAVSPIMTVPGGLNEGFVRKDAHLLVIIVSDEEDCSDQGALEGQPADDCYEERDKLASVNGLVEDILDVKKGENNLVQIGAVVGLEGGGCDDAYPGRRYQEAAALTGGLIGDICSGDWSNMLTELGLNASGIQMSFQTEYLAKPETLDVKVDGESVKEDPGNGWTYDTSTWHLTFHGASVPGRGAEISALYEIQSGADEPSGG
ncbi:MAG: hypothetical protein ACI8PZ_004260 [Myxococcota bacterium]|jgi:hypothetical protein